jgi:hypothetical protein
MSCPFNNSGGDQLDRGFYVQFAGDTLDTVTLQYFFGATGDYSVTLTARQGTYAGALLGQATVSFNATTTNPYQATFSFGGVSVAPGGIITFTQTVNTSASLMFYDTGPGVLGIPGSGCAGFTETEGTTPPLDTARRDSVGATITGSLGGGSGPGAAVPGCDVLINIPSTAVVGAFVADTPIYWTPGQATPYVLQAGKTAWVFGRDASGTYYKILWVCSFGWVPVSTMGPNYDQVWNGRPLPTDVVQ